MDKKEQYNFGHSEREGMLIGQIDEKDLQKEKYQEWYNANYEPYTVDETAVNSFKNELQDYDIQVYMGTWCGDSHREVPAFLKILKAADFPQDQLSIFALNRSKKTDFGIEKDKNITHVPTFVFYKKGKEMGRIVESPINSLEQDIQDIIEGHPQKPNYSK